MYNTDTRYPNIIKVVFFLFFSKFLKNLFRQAFCCLRNGVLHLRTCKFTCQLQTCKRHQTSKQPNVFLHKRIQGPSGYRDCLFPQAEALYKCPCFPRRPCRWKRWGQRTTATPLRHWMSILTPLARSIMHDSLLDHANFCMGFSVQPHAHFLLCWGKKCLKQPKVVCWS